MNLLADITAPITFLIALVLVVGLVVVLGIILRSWRKVEQGQALVRTGMTKTDVTFSGILVFPVIHKAEYMDISLKRLEINREGLDGLICKDNMRADIQVAFFVRVSPTKEDVLKVAQSIGCRRASDHAGMRELFDSKFSEALKTVGRQFDFVELYNAREQFRNEILKIIGTDLNGYSLDDCAIDKLEQTPLEYLNPNNILDSEGIKKITELTAKQAMLANHIAKEKEKIITQQNVEAQEAVLELNRQLAEATEKQKREIAAIKAREEAEAAKIQSEGKLKSEQARIAMEEEVEIAEQNKLRQVLVAQKNKERTDAVESERVERDRMLEVTERERIVALAEIEKTKAIETEQKNIQDVIRERVMVEKAVVEEKERIKDTEAFAEVERAKKVTLVNAEAIAQESFVKEVKAAEVSKKAAELKADQELYSVLKTAEGSRKATELKAEEDMLKVVKAAEADKLAAERRAEARIISADAEQQASEKESTGKQMMAEALTAESAAPGLGEAKVLEANATALERQGTAEAEVMARKFEAEAKGITQKAEAMKILDGVGREHEEFKLRLAKERDIELAEIHIQKDIAASHAMVVGEALKSAKIELLGGETQFFDKIISAVSNGRAVDRLVNNSQVLGDVKDTFFNGDPDSFRLQLKNLIAQFGMSSSDVKNLSVAALLTNLISGAKDDESRSLLTKLQGLAQRLGMDNKRADSILRS